MQNRIFGYMRVSTRDQNEDRQRIDLIQNGVEEKNIYMDKLSGKDFHRPGYQTLVNQRLREGDLLVIKSIDRLGRNYQEILAEWKKITKEIRADVRILDMPLLDTRQSKDLIGTLISDIVLQLLSFVAENERDNIRRRQSEGIAAARQRGVRFGRPLQDFPEGFEEIYWRWRKKEITPQEAMDSLGVSYDKFYRLTRKKRQMDLKRPPAQEQVK